MTKKYLHYGDAAHPPMLTSEFTGTAKELRTLRSEAKREGTPLRVQTVREKSASSKPLSFKTPRRVQITVSSGSGYFKKGQYAYVISHDDRGGMYWIDKDGHSEPGERAYLVSKTKDMRGGALWFSEDGIRFTKGRK